MNDPILQTIAQNFPPEYKTFIDSGYIDAMAQKLGAEHNLEQPDVVVVRNGFNLYLHFVLLASELTNFFVEEAGLEPATAEAIASAFITDLPSSFTDQHSHVVQEMRTEPTNSTQNEAPIAPNHTNSERVDQTHISSQDDLLGGRN